MQAGGRRFDSVHLHQFGHQLEHPVMPIPFRFSRRGIWFDAPAPLRRCACSREGKGAEAATRAVQRFQDFFIKAKSSARLVTLFVLIRCLSLWIGLLDEGFDLRPVAVMCA